jgi:hypothetical protein
MSSNGTPFLVSKEQRFRWGQLTFRSAVSQLQSHATSKFFRGRGAILLGLQTPGYNRENGS